MSFPTARRTLARLAPALVAALSLAAPAAGAPASAAPRWHTSLADARAEAAKTGKPMLVDLFAEWCGWCRQLEREVFASPEFADAARELVLLRVDVEDGGEGTALQARYAAYSLPTALLLDADGVRLGEVSGYAPTAAYMEALRGQMAGWRRLLAAYETAMAAPAGTPEGRARLAEVGAELRRRHDGARAARLYERLAAAVSGPAREEALVRSADALLLAGDADGAAGALARVRRGDLPPGPLHEQLDLLQARVAQEAGDCERAVASFERFIAAYPRSPMLTHARRALVELNACA